MRKYLTIDEEIADHARRARKLHFKLLAVIVVSATLMAGVVTYAVKVSLPIVNMCLDTRTAK